MNIKKFFTLIVLNAVCIIGATAAAPGNRVIYGFNRASAEWADGTKDYDCGFVSYPFDLSERGTVLTSYLPTPNISLFAGAGLDGIIYGCEYEFVSATEPTKPLNLIAYNVFSGHIEQIGPWNPEGTEFRPSDMTFDVKTGKLYALGFDGVIGLYEVDITSGQFTLLHPLEAGATLAADAKGTLYTIDHDGILYTINKENGRLTEIFDTGLSGIMKVQSMDFDHTTGKLYWAACVTGHPASYENVWLQEIDLSDPTAITIEEIGNVGVQSTFIAMHIPSADSLEAPTAPSDVTSEIGEEGTLEARLKWTNPTQTFGGEDVGTLYGVVIKRNGETVKTFSKDELTPVMSYIDNVPVKGDYRYDIQAINANGVGAKGTAFQFVGPDKPSMALNPTGKVEPGMNAITLSWEAPEKGYKGGHFNPADVTYKITRIDGVVVADNLKETTFTDSNLLRLLNYSYTIEAVNEEGSTPATCGSFIAGPALDLPFEQLFEAPNVKNYWTCVDANKDSFTWMFATPLGQVAFGDYVGGAEYIAGTTMGMTESADEWLISPPLNFKAGEEYEFEVSARCYGTGIDMNFAEEKFDLYLGSANSVEAMTSKLGSFTVGDTGIDEASGSQKFEVYSATIPEFSEDTVASVALNLVTPLTISSFFQVNYIYIGKKDPNSVTSIPGSVKATVRNGMLTISGDFAEATLYNLQGMRVANIKDHQTATSSFASGIYVLNIDGQCFKLYL